MSQKEAQILLHKGPVLEIQFNRPEKKNAVTKNMYRLLHQALEKADRDDEVRAVLIRGSDGCFCAGNDIGDLATASSEEDDAAQKFMQGLATIGKPLVAAVSGPAVGIGTTLLLHCDFVYADDSARFTTPFTALGVCPEAASSFLLRERVGYLQAADMLLLGTTLEPQRAAAIGLISGVVPAEQLLEMARNTAARLASLSRPSVQATRRLLRHGLPEASQQALEREIAAFVELLQSEEAQQAFAAFFEQKKT